MLRWFCGGRTLKLEKYGSAITGFSAQQVGATKESDAETEVELGAFDDRRWLRLLADERIRLPPVSRDWLLAHSTRCSCASIRAAKSDA
jgi:hypothetical protein